MLSLLANFRSDSPFQLRIVEIILVALLYIVSARIGQAFAISPGNVTPVWLPSGIMLALAVIRGPGIWPGVFLGAFAGNVWAYFSLDSWMLATQALLAGSFNGIGDVLSTVGVVQLLRKYYGDFDILSNFTDFAAFLILAVVLGPGVSALFGVTSLATLEFLPWPEYWSTLVTWWVGDGVGALLLGPFLIGWYAQVSTRVNKHFWLRTFILVLCSALLACILFKIFAAPKWLYLLSYSIAPLLLIASLYLGQTHCLSSILAFSSVAIVATSLGTGPFSLSDPNLSLLELQLFIAVMSIIIILMSITVRQRTEAQFEVVQREKSLAEAQQIASLGSWELDLATNDLFWSEQVYRIFEVDPQKFKASYEGFINVIHPEDRELVNSAYSNSIQNRTPYEIEHRLLMNDGRIKYVYERCETQYSEEGEPLRSMGTVLDITEQKRAEQKIIHQAHYDGLTKLPNRFLVIDRLSQLLVEADRDNTKVAVLLLDLDFFKNINDAMGHDAGDKLLVCVSERLRNAVRAGDTVGRLSGDEFLVLLRGLHGFDEANIAVDNLLESCRSPFFIDGRQVMITSSIGVVMYPGDGENATEVLRNADLAMYQAKEQGRNSYSFFTQEMNQKVARHLAIEDQMRGALDRNEFSVHYQAQADFESGQIMRAEALLRWNNAALGSVAPDEFIPVAEATGMIVPLGKFVLDQALCLLSEIRHDLGEQVVISVNLSPRQFRDQNLIKSIKKRLKQYQLPAHAIELEITEGLLASAYANVDEMLNAIHEMGINISLDDFGTGYASLNYLKSYPFDELKIDRCFIEDVESEDGKELVNAAIAMSHALGLRVVAEGVENATQYDILKSLGCDFAQGYFISKPVAHDEFVKLIRN